MKFSTFVGGIGPAFQGFKQGQDEEKARQDADLKRVRDEEDRAYQKTQRAFQGEQQAQQRKDWASANKDRAKKDQLETDLAAVPSETVKDFSNPDAPKLDDEGTPSAAALPAKVTTPVPQDTQLRQQAAAYRKAGDMENWLKNHQAADKFAFDRSAKKFQELRAMPTTATALDVAKAAAEIYNTDPLPGQVSDIQDLGEGGVKISFTNRETGGKAEKVFKNRDELLAGLEAYYSPESYAKLQDARAAAHAKVQEEIAKNPLAIVPAGAQAFDKRTGKLVASNDNGYVQDGFNEDGTPRMVKPGTRGAGAGGGSSAGAGKGGKGGDLIDQAGELLKTAIKNPETPGALLQPQAFLEGIYRSHPNMDPRTAAFVAADAAANPTKVAPDVSSKDGTISLVYADPKVAGGRQFNLAPGGATIEEFEKFHGGPAKVAPLVRAMLDKQGGDTAEAIIKASRDQAFNAQIIETIKQQARPEAVRADLAAWNNKVLLAQRYLPASPTKIPSMLDRLKAPVGGAAYTPPADSPAGRAAAARAQAGAATQQRTAAQLAEQQALGEQFRRDAKALPPLELARKYDDLRAQLPTEDAAALQAIEKNIR